LYAGTPANVDFADYFQVPTTGVSVGPGRHDGAADAECPKEISFERDFSRMLPAASAPFMAVLLFFCPRTGVYATIYQSIGGSADLRRRGPKEGRPHEKWIANGVSRSTKNLSCS